MVVTRTRVLCLQISGASREDLRSFKILNSAVSAEDEVILYLTPFFFLSLMSTLDTIFFSSAVSLWYTLHRVRMLAERKFLDIGKFQKRMERF